MPCHSPCWPTSRGRRRGGGACDGSGLQLSSACQGSLPIGGESCLLLIRQPSASLAASYRLATTQCLAATEAALTAPAHLTASGSSLAATAMGVLLVRCGISSAKGRVELYHPWVGGYFPWVK